MSSLKTYAVLTHVRSQLAKELETAGAVARFKEAHGRHPALVPFDTPAQVVAFMNAPGAGTTRDRSAIARALIREAQARENCCWLSLLTLVFFPSLVQIRSSIGTVCGMCPDEVDALVLHAFVEAVAGFPLPSQGKLCVINLAWATKKVVGKELRRHNQWKERMGELPEEADDTTPDDGPDAEQALLERERDGLLSPGNLRRLLAQVMASEDADTTEMLLSTYGSGVPLIDYVRALHPDAGEEEFRQVYARCRRQRSRLMGRLNSTAVALAMSHSEPTAALLYQEATDGDHGTDAPLGAA